jgi:hypothetical protein
MALSVEIRWFGQGAPSECAVKWFDGCAPEQRSDTYLLADPALGLKRRGSKQAIEAKVLVDRLLPICVVGRQLHPEVHYKFDLAELQKPLPEVVVEKHRQQRKFQLISRPTGSQSQPTSRIVGAGTAVELATLVKHDITYWTFALEAFSEEDVGRASQSMKSLIATMPLIPESVLATIADCTLTTYAAWVFASND